jgi:hypothetical protein
MGEVDFVSAGLPADLLSSTRVIFFGFRSGYQFTRSLANPSENVRNFPDVIIVATVLVNSVIPAPADATEKWR